MHITLNTKQNTNLVILTVPPKPYSCHLTETITVFKVKPWVEARRWCGSGAHAPDDGYNAQGRGGSHTHTHTHTFHQLMTHSGSWETTVQKLILPIL